MKTTNKLRIAVGLSGGVDSAYAAAILVKNGHDVTGIFLKIYETPRLITSTCPWEADFKMAQKVSKHLSIPLVSWNFEKQYREEILSKFIKKYRDGYTPNPDISCNKFIKFGYFLNRALKENYDYIATGHYAQTVCARNGHMSLLRGLDATKDQSYFLSSLSQEQLRKALFPIGHLTKRVVRQHARILGLPNANRPDSQGICFIGEIPMMSFLRSYIPDKKGEIRDSLGAAIGEHLGLHLFTIGQRYGLGIGGRKKPLYVSKKIVDENALVVVEGNKHPDLFSQSFTCRKAHWIEKISKKSFTCIVQIRYHSKPCIAHVQLIGAKMRVALSERQRAVTPGQIAVFYDKMKCLGNAEIY